MFNDLKELNAPYFTNNNKDNKQATQKETVQATSSQNTQQ